ncbi:S8 family serine peptidase [Roseiconus nitratireducens]|uniref:S8 family serine peptidase n=1 Tax=Roseiconus nitratireducens TaxID=2605748 RepID=A0A5M6D3P8_9BACT|nr:S8 family peptidase [Roseiconus nitratireducens]KAA5540912.1 S8 family serine peptidase [Roseiconus nitratireducens]
MFPNPPGRFAQSRYRCLTRGLENLERRCLLSFDYASMVQVAPGLAVDPGDYEEGSLLVKYKQTGIGAVRVTESLGATVGRAYTQIPGLHQVKLPSGVKVADVLPRFRNNPNVLYAEPDFRLHTTALPNDPRYDELWGLNNTGQTGGTVDADSDIAEAWDIATGSNLVVAVIDTGVDYLHEDLAANMWVNAGEIPGDGIDNDGNGFVDDIHGYDFANDDPDPMDDQGHGTHVAGTIGAVGDNGIGVVGVNWDVQLMAVKFLDATGNGTTSDAVDAINYAVANGAQIANASWGGNEPFSQALYDAIAGGRDAGQIFIAGAGNGNAFGFGQDNDSNPFYPASYDLDNIISVAATDHNDARATFSNYGITSVDLAGPGVSILSTRPGNSYELLSGTSMATPHVAGVASLVWQHNPTWTADQVIEQILNSVDPVSSMQGITTTGGRLNAAAALGEPVPPPPPPPPATLPVSEDFEDALAQDFQVRVGTWGVTSGRYAITPVMGDPSASAVSTVRLETPLADDMEVFATANAAPEIGFFFNYLSNGYIVFDYQDNFDFKYAGFNVVSGQWVIGQRSGSGWQNLATLSDAGIAASTDVGMRLTIEDGQSVTLYGKGAPVLSHSFAESVVDGQVGVGAQNSQTAFDNVYVNTFVSATPAALPIQEDFSDGTADNFQPQTPGWSVSGGAYQVDAFTGANAFSTLQVDGALPADLELRATANVHAPSGSQSSNALLVFDYHNENDFKFVAAYAGTDQWVIGVRGAGWTTVAETSEAVETNVDYDMQVVIEDGSSVTLLVDGVVKATHTFADSVTDGVLGLGTLNASVHFDDLVVQEYLPPPPPPPGSLPIVEDFSDGLADYFQPQLGNWSVNNGQYFGSPSGDALSTLNLAEALPSDLDFRATVAVQQPTSGLYQNAVMIFDYQSPTNFKFAGAYAGTDQWVIGQRTSQWVTLASAGAAVDVGVDYDLRLVIQAGNQVALYANGALQTTYAFSGSVTDGAIGLGTWNALARFDDVSLQTYVAPPPPPAASLPLSEDFSDGVADFFQPQVGDWLVNAGRYQGSPSGDAVTTLNVAEPLPTELEFRASVTVHPPAYGFYQNGLLIFDYQSPTNFKFAGAYAGTDQWVIGHRTSQWITDASAGASIDVGTDYELSVVIEGDHQVTLLVDGVPQTSHTFSDSLTDGDLGFGTWNAVASYDDVSVQSYVAPPPPPPPPAGTLPVAEDFSDGVADYFQPQVGDWAINAGRYVGTPAGDAVSTLALDAPLPSDLEFQATVNIQPPSGGLYQNGLLVFDYQSPTDFKFAGAYAGTNQWVIGHRTSQWVTDAFAGSTVNVGVDYDLRLVIEGGNQVTLWVGETPQVTYSFAESVTDGDIGLGTWNAVAKYDQIVVQAYTPPPPPPAAELPVQEDYSDGLADLFVPRRGTWTVSGGEYHASPSGDAISTLEPGGALPTDLEFQATARIQPPTYGVYQNAVVIFDYQSPTNFKFAGAYAGTNEWVIGTRTSSWTVLASYGETVNVNVDYTLRLVIDGDHQATLFVDGLPKTTHTFNGSLTDGSVGLATWNAIAHFDDVSLQATGTSVAALTVGTSVLPETNADLSDPLLSLPAASSRRSSAGIGASPSDTSAGAASHGRGNGRPGSPQSISSESPLDQVFAELEFDLMGDLS